VYCIIDGMLYLSPVIRWRINIFILRV